MHYIYIVYTRGDRRYDSCSDDRLDYTLR